MPRVRLGDGSADQRRLEHPVDRLGLERGLGKGCTVPARCPPPGGRESPLRPARKGWRTGRAERSGAASGGDRIARLVTEPHNLYAVVRTPRRRECTSCSTCPESRSITRKCSAGTAIGWGKSSPNGSAATRTPGGAPTTTRSSHTCSE